WAASSRAPASFASYSFCSSCALALFASASLISLWISCSRSSRTALTRPNRNLRKKKYSTSRLMIVKIMVEGWISSILHTSLQTVRDRGVQTDDQPVKTMIMAVTKPKYAVSSYMEAHSSSVLLLLSEDAADMSKDTH